MYIISCIDCISYVVYGWHIRYFYYPALTAVVESMRFLCWRCLVEAGIYQEREVGPEESKACEEYEEEGRVSHSEPVFLAGIEGVDELTEHLQQGNEQTASDETKSENISDATQSLSATPMSPHIRNF